MSAFPRSFRLVLPLALLIPACPGDDVTPSDTDDDSTSTGDSPMTMTTAMTTMTTAGMDESSSDGGMDTTTTGDDDDDDDDTTTTGDDDDDDMTDSSSSTTGGMCGDDMVDGDEECDGDDLDGQDCAMQGFDGGTLACGDDCTFDTSMCFMMDCGDDTVDGKEQCDGDNLDGADCASLGFVDGTLSCAKNCMFDTSACNSCGNDVVDGDDVCDGTALGGEDCVSQGAMGGTLGCLPDCSGYDLSMCDGCGNGVVDPGEDCDGADLDEETCASQGFVDGTLTCAADCTFDTGMCGSGSGDCCASNGSAGCDDAVCVSAVCGEDPYCCETTWDGLCANVANGVCNVCMGGMGDCCEANGTQGCNDAACVFALCGFGGADEPDCCNTDWDQGCVDVAVLECPVCFPPNCGDGTLDMDELCDTTETGAETCMSQGFDSGTLGCADNCGEYDTSTCGTCGNGLTDGDELCDAADLSGETCVTQGFDSGTLTCDATCDGFDTTNCGTCGNMAIDGAEACDGMDLGGATCASLGLGGGTLGCTPGCGYDTSMCDIPGVPFGSDGGYAGIELPVGMTTCDDISATGTPTGQSDDSTVTVGIGFTFPFYGTDFTDVNVDSNGAIRFGGTTQVGLANACLPDDINNNLYVFWDDLNPAAAGNIFTQTLGMAGDQRFVVQYDVPNFNGDTADLMRFQVMLSEATGAIDVCYVDTINAGNTADNGAEATAGIQMDGASFIQFSCNTADLVSGLQLRYIPI